MAFDKFVVLDSRIRFKATVFVEAGDVALEFYLDPK